MSEFPENVQQIKISFHLGILETHAMLFLESSILYKKILSSYFTCASSFFKDLIIFHSWLIWPMKNQMPELLNPIVSKFTVTTSAN